MRSVIEALLLIGVVTLDVAAAASELPDRKRHTQDDPNLVEVLSKMEAGKMGLSI
jgi:hypothetical protein